MANYEKIVVIPAALEENFHRFLQKGKGLTQQKDSKYVKEESKPRKSILKKPSETKKIKNQDKIKKPSVKKSVVEPAKKQVKWLKL